MGSPSSTDTHSSASREGQLEHAHRIARPAIFLAGLGGLALALTMGWQMSIAAYFGATPELDAYWLALALPKAMVDSVHLGILTLLFIIVFSLSGEKTDGERFALGSSLINMVLLSTAVVIPVLVLEAEWVIRRMGPGLSAELWADGARQLRLLGLLLIPTSLTGAMAGVLHAKQRFLPFATARIVGLAAQIGFVALFASRMGVDVLIWAMMTGAVITLVGCTPAFRATGFRYSPTIALGGGRYRIVFQIFFALIAFAVLDRLNQISDRYFASTLAAGSISALEYGWRFEIPISHILSMSIALPSLAMMAAHAVDHDVLLLRRTLAISLRLLAMLVVPLIGFLFVLREPLTRLWFQRGVFSPDAALLVSSLIPGLSVMFLMRAIGTITVYSLMAVRRLGALLIVLAIEVALNTVLNAVLVGPLQLRGVVIATAIAMVCGNAAMVGLLLHALDRWPARALLARVRKPIAVSGLTVLLLSACVHLVPALGETVWGVGASGLVLVVTQFVLARASGLIELGVKNGRRRVRLGLHDWSDPASDEMPL